MPSPGTLLLAVNPKLASVKLVGEQLDTKGPTPVWRMYIAALKNEAENKELDARLGNLTKTYNAQTSTADAPTPARVLIQKRFVSADELAKEKLPVGYTSLPM